MPLNYSKNHSELWVKSYGFAKGLLLASKRIRFGLQKDSFW